MGSRTDGLDTVISERAIAQAAGQVASDYHDSYQVASKGRFNLKGEGLPRVGNLETSIGFLLAELHICPVSANRKSTTDPSAYTPPVDSL
jgi:hypothetical protein